MNLILCHYISCGLVCPTGDCTAISGPAGEMGPPGRPGLEGIPGNILQNCNVHDLLICTCRYQYTSICM